MTVAGIHPVSSKEHMLEPTDIFVVASHEDKKSQEMMVAGAKKAGISTERMLYTVMINEYGNKGLIRIRAGNTLFTIAAFEGRVGLVRSYNGDTAENFVENMHQFLESAQKMGFNTLLAQTHTPEIVRLLKIAVRKMKDPAVKTQFNSAKGIFAITIGQKRD